MAESNDENPLLKKLKEFKSNKDKGIQPVVSPNEVDVFGTSTLKKKDLSGQGSKPIAPVSAKPSPTSQGINEIPQIDNGLVPEFGNQNIPSPLTPQGAETFNAEQKVKQTKATELSNKLNEYKATYDANKGFGASDKITEQSQNIPQSNLTETPTEIERFKSGVKNSIENIGTSLQGVPSRLSLTATDLTKRVFDKEINDYLSAMPRLVINDDGIHMESGMTVEEIQQQSLNKLNELSNETKETESITGNLNFSNPLRLAGGVVDAVSSLASTALPSITSGGSLLLSEMVGASVYDYNKTKADKEGISVNELYNKGKAEFKTPAIFGGIAFGLEHIGLKGVENAMTKKLTGSFGKKATSLALDWNKEGATEWLQTGIESANIAVANGATAEEATEKAMDAMFSAQGLEAFAKGFAGSASASGAGRLGKSFLSKNREVLSKLKQSKYEAWNDIANPDVPLSTKEDIADVIVDANEKIKKIEDKESEAIANMSEEDATKVEDLTGKIDDIDVALENVSESTKAVLEKQKEESQKEIDEILSKKPSVEKPSTTIQPNDIVNYTDEAGNVLEVPVEAINGDVATIGINNEGIYETKEVPLQSLIKNEETKVDPEQGVVDAKDEEGVQPQTSTAVTDSEIVNEVVNEVEPEIKPKDAKIIVEESLPKSGDLKGVTELKVSEDGKSVSYGTKSNQINVSVKGMSAEDIKTEIDYEKQMLEKNKKDVENFSEDEIRMSRGMTNTEKADAIKFNKQQKENIVRVEKIVLPFYEKHLELAENKNAKPTEIKPEPTNVAAETDTATGEAIETGDKEADLPNEVISEKPLKNAKEKEVTPFKDIRTKNDTPEGIAKTVNSKTWYHGSGKDLTNESVSSASFSRPDGLLGLGFYMTDNPKIAETYANLGRNKKAGIVNELKIKTDKILDAEKPIDKEVEDLYKSTFEYYVNEVVDSKYFFDEIKIKNPNVTLMDYHKSIREFLGENEYPVSEVHEAFQDLEAGLKDKLGYDAISHIGGVQTNGEKHNVLILLDPSSEYSNPKNYFEKKSLYNKYEDSNSLGNKGIKTETQTTKKDTAKAKVKNRTEKALSNDPRSFREAILQYFLSGGSMKTDDFIRITGFGYKTNKAGNKVATDELRKAKFLGFVKDDGEMADMILMNYVPEAFQKDGGMDLVSEIAELAASGTKGKMLSEIESTDPDNVSEGVSEAEINYLNEIEAQEEKLNELLTEDEVAFINSPENASFYENLIDEINNISLTDQEVESLLAQKADITDSNGAIDWNKVEDDYTKNEWWIQLSDINKETFVKLIEYGSTKARQQAEQAIRSQSVANENSNIQQDETVKSETTAGRTATAVDEKVNALNEQIDKQKKKIQKELDKLSSANDMFASAGVNDGTKAPKLFDDATNTDTENINRIIEPLQAELETLTKERDDLIENKDAIIAEAEKQQQLFNDQTGTQDADIMANSMNPLPKIMGSVNKLQEKYIADNTRKVEDWIANTLNTWGESKNWFARNASHIATSIMNGIPRSQANLTGKLNLTGGLNKARYDAKKALENLYAVVNGDTQSLERIHQVIDPVFYIDQGLNPVDYNSLSKEEQVLHDELRKILDGVHRRNFALGFINKETYEKFKGIYSPRLYETFEIPDDVQTLLDEQMRHNPVTKLDLGQFKGRKEVDELSQKVKDAILKDPVYGAVKRLMQLDQNAAIAGYINDIIADTPHLVKNPKNSVIPDGYKLMSGKGYGKLDGKYVPNYIAEDFKGFYMINETMNKFYDWSKAYDRFGFRQFLKKSYTVYNPVVQLGNFVSNFTFAFAAGVDPVTFATGLPNAYKSLKSENADYQTLLKAGILGTDIVTADLLPLQSKQGKSETKPNIAMKAWNWFDENTSKVYGMSDEIAKMNAFLIFKDQGFTEQEAIQKVYEGFQNYATVGKMWDATAKTPLIGNPFIKFQADLFRILKNGALRTPVTTSMYLTSLYMMPEIMKLIGLSDKDEDDKEEELRTSRSFIPKVPLGFTDIPLVYKTRFGEVNLARYMSPFFLFDTGGNSLGNLVEKVLPVDLVEKEQAGKGNTSTSVYLSDPLLGTLTSALFTDTDFRGKSIQDPDATRFRASGATTGEKIANKATFLARSWVPQGSQLHDFYLSQKYGEDFYGRTRTLSQSLINMVVKVQDWKEGDYKKEAEKRLDVNLSKMKNITDERKNIIKNNSKKREGAYDDFDSNKISKEQLDRRIDKFDSELEERLKKNEDNYSDVMKNTDEFVKKYEEFLK